MKILIVIDFNTASKHIHALIPWSNIAADGQKQASITQCNY